MLLLNKPLGLSSNQALQNAKRLLNANKAGHTGSLDPLATGVLPLCFGETTKIASFFLDGSKEYKVAIRLGVETATGDCEGEVIGQKDVNVSLSHIQDVLSQFRGDFKQMPPMFSALKRNGQPLYKLARKGIEVEREPRAVTVYSLCLDSWHDKTLELTVSCSKGFYIRSLAMDIGTALGCGGHVTKLCRTALGQFSLSETSTLEQLEAKAGQRERERMLLPTDSALSAFPSVMLPQSLANYLCHGQAVRPLQADQPRCDSLIRIYSDNGSFLGLGEWSSEGKLLPKKIFSQPDLLS